MRLKSYYYNIMKNLFIPIIICLISSLSVAQNTINAIGVSLVGNQQSQFLSVSLLPYSLIDVEAEAADLEFNIANLQLEAGKSIFTDMNLPAVWLNTSIRNNSGSRAFITAKTNATLPEGVEIWAKIVQATIFKGSEGNGVYSTEAVLLSDVFQVIISDIPNSISGDGLNWGYKIEYEIRSDSSISLPDSFAIEYQITQS